MTIDECLSGCIKHDIKSQKFLYETYRRQMHGICLRYCKNEDDAADVLQEGFIKVFKNIGQYRNDGELAAWIRMIMIRTALASLKKQKDFLPIEEHIKEAGEYEMNINFDSFTFDKLVLHLRSLPTGYQAVFNLFVFEELNHQEIADILNCSEATSRSQLFKARKAMQKLIMHDQQLNKLVAHRL
ncbi:MAG: sigma-70 family RNA polymerase sigma factor [Flavobacteriales bacterium]|nr:sigma-70 family RNA polymerase sigma factor [Flavobacteriales bacterium]